MVLATHDLEEIDPPASSSLSAVIGDLGASGEDLPADRTRIESNPLERINEAEAESAKSKPDMQTVALPASGALPLPAIPTGPRPASPVRSSSGKFPEAANLPTMIAEPDPDSGPTVSPELAKTELGAPLIIPPPASDANARTVLGMVAPTPDQIARAVAGMTPPPQVQRPPGGEPQHQPQQHQPQHPQHPPQPQQPMGSGPNMAPGQGPNLGSGPNMAQGPNLGSGPNMAQGPGPNMSPGSGPNMPPVGPAGYPVMNAQMRDQMASGATVFPSGRGNGPNDRVGPDPASPVGFDWGPGGAMPGRAMPPWKLALLFVGAVGGALLITVLIALAAR